MHISDSTDDPHILEAVQRYKSDGYYVFFRVLEIMAREFNIHHPGFLEINFGVLMKKLFWHHKKAPLLTEILRYFDSKDRIKVFYNEVNSTLSPVYLDVNSMLSRLYSPNKLGIEVFYHADNLLLECHKLAELADNFTKQEIKKCEVTLKQDIDLDIDKNKNKNKDKDKKENQSLFKSSWTDFEISNAKSVIDHFNNNHGRRFGYSDDHMEIIIKRFRGLGKNGKEVQKITVADCILIIDFKAKSEQFIERPDYLNPETLFRPSNFEKYLSGAAAAQNQPQSTSADHSILTDEESYNKYRKKT